LAATLLLPVPAFAIQKSVKARGRGHVKINQTRGNSATQVIQQQFQDRLNYIAFSNAVRAQFPGASGPLRQTINRYLKNVLAELRAQWKIETITGIVSPFQFPAI
jgi:hypothetical protein